VIFLFLFDKSNIYITFIAWNKFLVKSGELLRQLKNAGIKIERHGKGSHIILVNKEGSQFSFPYHGSNEIGKGMENKVKKWAGLK